MPKFRDPFFKVISKSDSGEGNNHIAGILIPVSSRPYFPALLPPTKPGLLRESFLDAILVLRNGKSQRTQIRYSLQHPDRPNGETRITGGLAPLRQASRKGDIILVERSRSAPVTWRLSILRKGSAEHGRARKVAGARKFGVLNGWNGSSPPFDRTKRGVPPSGMYRSRPLPGRRKFIARLDRVDAIGTDGRRSWEFDGFDERYEEEEINRAFDDPEFRAPFALLQINAGPGELKGRFRFDAEEGAWAEITVDIGSARAPLQTRVAQLAVNGYTDEYRGVVTEIRLLAPPGEGPRMFPEIGASVASATKKYYRVKTRSSLPAAAGANSAGIRRILHAALTRTAFVQVRDVGQASFATLLAADGSELAHYDAGWPISYNRHTAPSIPPVATKVPVILSHWDWDHLHAWHSVEELRSSCWIVPRQEVGPGAAKLAKALHAKKQLKVCGGKSVVVGASTLIRCSGGSGLNDTGLALGLALANGRRVLLIGDADYSFCALPAGWKGCDALIATHHGAMFHGAVPGPTNQNDLCVISVGYGNIYHHPFQAAVSLHKAVGWRVSRTSMHGKTARGDRMLS